MNYLATHQVQIAAFQSDIARKNNRIAALERERAKLSECIQVQNTRIVEQGLEEARLHEQCHRLNEDLQRQRETCDSLRLRVAELEQEVAWLQLEKERLQAESVQLRAAAGLVVEAS